MLRYWHIIYVTWKFNYSPPHKSHPSLFRCGLVSGSKLSQRRRNLCRDPTVYTASRQEALWVTSKEMTSESCLLEDCRSPETSGECLFIINIRLTMRGRKNLRAGRPRKTKSKRSDLGRQLCRWREMTGSFIEEESTDCHGYFNTSWGKGNGERLISSPSSDKCF